MRNSHLRYRRLEQDRHSSARGKGRLKRGIPVWKLVLLRRRLCRRFKGRVCRIGKQHEQSASERYQMPNSGRRGQTCASVGTGVGTSSSFFVLVCVWCACAFRYKGRCVWFFLFFFVRVLLRLAVSPACSVYRVFPAILTVAAPLLRWFVQPQLSSATDRDALTLNTFPSSFPPPLS